MDLFRLNACELRDKLNSGETTSVAIVESLHRRQEFTEPHIRGFTCNLREASLAAARNLDLERQQGKIRGPFHGLPLSVKDNIAVLGTPTTVGVKTITHNIAKQDAAVVRKARAAGAIILGKSNVPQAMLSMRCDNSLYGPCFNPWSRNHVTGGSSSGEGALIASGASVIGLGTDLGGSVRFPAAFCGVSAFKPSYLRLSKRGVQSAIAGQSFLESQVGLLARSPRDIALALETLAPSLADDQSYDAETDQLIMKLKNLKIAVCLDDGFISPVPAMSRAVEDARNALEEIGLRTVDWTMNYQQELVELYLAAMSADGFESLKALLKDDKVLAMNRRLWLLGRFPKQLRKGFARGLKTIGEKQLALALKAGGKKSTREFWQLCARRAELAEVVEQQWDEQSVDLLITPACPTPALPLGYESDSALIFSYFGRYNMLRFPAGVTPITRVLESETAVAKSGEHTQRKIATAAQSSAGLPVAVQVVAKPGCDQQALWLLMLLEKLVKDRANYPTTPIDPDLSGSMS